MNPNQIPQNPLREFDELYVKDEKVLQADSEQIANEWFKKHDDENFRKELELLTVELQQLDEGKLSDPFFHPLPLILRHFMELTTQRLRSYSSASSLGEN
jgi:hypothetical protein